MPSVLVQQLDMGLDALVSNNMIDPRGAAQGTENVLYEYGIMRTPSGFAKLDLTTGLNSGETVLKIMQYEEYDRTSHLMAVTNSKIYDHNNVTSDWDDKTGSAINAYIESPISYAAIAHNDTDIYLDDNTSKEKQYYHLIVCDGGRSNIQRWAGKNETAFLPVTGADGYATGGSTHRALQVGVFQNRLILISPLEWDNASGVWVQNKNRVRWPAIGKLQTWEGTGSGFVDLLDTGDENVWSASLGSTYIVYQNNSIWDLGYVGGTTVFSPRPTIPDLGLLSPGALASKNNAHYFVGNDYNIYAYYGGTVKQSIGDKISKFLREDLDPVYENRCRLVMGENSKWLHVFIVENGYEYITKAYSMNMLTGAWTTRDWTNMYTSTTGITAASLVGAQTYTTGDSYTEALATLSAYDSADNTSDTAGDTTIRYGDVLCDSTFNQLDWSTLSAVGDYDFSFNEVNTEFSTGGLFACFSYANDPTKLVGDDTDYSNKIIRMDDCSDSSLMPNGSHYYTITDVSSTLDAGSDYTVRIDFAPRGTGYAVCATAAQIPVFGGDTSASLYDPSGETYNSELQTTLVSAKLVYGDSEGLVYQADETISTEDGNNILSRHLTPVIDYGTPDKYKRHNKLTYTAKERTTGNGGVKVRFRTGNFDTSETGWVDVTQTLTSDWEEYDAYVNRSSKRVQFNFESASGSDFEVREAEIHAESEANR